MAPWFELTPASPSVDERLDEHDAGVAAALELHGAIAGLLPDDLHKRVEEGAVVLGGGPVPRGAPADSELKRLRRRFRAQCTIRLRVAASGLSSGRQCLLVFSLWGAGNAGLQVFLGAMAIDEVGLRDGPERLALLIDVGRQDALLLDLWLRLCGDHEHARVAVRGVQGFLL